jgi:uncharacterized protein (TIGR02757 family)
MPKRLKKSIGQKRKAIIELLDEMNQLVEVPEYIEQDPVQFMHLYSEREDRLVAGFFAAIMAWGRRDIVIAKVSELLQRCEHRPAVIAQQYSERELERFEGFKHRTFKPEDVHSFFMALREMYDQFGDFEAFWRHCYGLSKTQKRPLFGVFHEQFFALYPEAPMRSRKHLANPEKGSSAKRLWLYLRWSIRQNSCVDTGLMHFMPTSELKLPLDVHVARWARALGLLTRAQNDAQAVDELTATLKKYKPEDPSAYDYGLFGIGVQKKEVSEALIVNPWILEA